ncbi:MAG: sulfurtransferase-like selenium metabolism protein YedF [Syntrophus sp. (in: bacteria)]|nr:sulfurtransferase-like selenium metabolism protein YedF [Syntrophus sp. (in: bacteria)]
MSEIIDAKGLACPEPVILTKKALEAHGDIVVLVDNTTAMENIRRLASNAGCSVEIADEAEGIFRIHLMKQGGGTPGNLTPEYLSCNTDAPLAAAGPTVFVIASDTMGRGNDELGSVLMRAFIHTAAELESLPDVMIFYNAGVKLTSEGSDVLDNLKKLEEKGVTMLVCGTCVNYFNLTGKVAAGVVSNMYDIAGILSRAGRIVQP